jgi:hypothetical protein
MAEFWQGRKPEKCDVCHAWFKIHFVIGRTVMQRWSILCPDCHERVGTGIGVGLLQVYKEASGEDGSGRTCWLMTGG